MSAVVEPAGILAGAEVVDSFRALGITAFTTGRAAGSFGWHSEEPVRDLTARWSALRTLLGGYETARLIHFLAMSGLVVFFVVHVTMVALVPKTLWAMIRGR